MAQARNRMTPDRVKAKLGELSPTPKVSAAAIEAYCRKAGRPYSNPERLAERLKQIQDELKADHAGANPRMRWPASEGVPE
jgi:hypothetical protein